MGAPKIRQPAFRALRLRQAPRHPPAGAGDAVPAESRGAGGAAPEADQPAAQFQPPPKVRRGAGPGVGAPLLALLVALALAAAAQVVVRTAAHGPAVTGPSVVVAAVAERIRAGDGFTDSRADVLTPPPLYPLLLAAGGVAGLTTADAARVVNAAAVGALVLVAGVWLARNIRSRLLAGGSAAALTVCGPVAHFGASLHGGALFALFALLALTQLARARHVRSRLLAAVFAMLAAATEFAGATLIIAGGAVILWQRPGACVSRAAPEEGCGPLAGQTPRRRTNWRAAALFAGISAWPLAVVLLHNVAAFGDALAAPGLWRGGDEAFAPAPTERWLAAVPAEHLFYVVLALLGLAGAGLGRRVRGVGCGSRHAEQLRVFAVFACVYAVAALASGTVGDAVSARLLPLLAPGVLTTALLLDALAAAQPGRAWRVALTIVAGAAGAAAARAEVAISLQAMKHGYWGRAYNTPHWQAKGMIPHLLRRGLASGYSNRANLLRFSLRTATGQRAPGRYLPLPPALADLAALPAGATIVWFYDAPPEYGYGIAELLEQPSLATLLAFRNGAVLRRTTLRYSNGAP